MAGAFVGLSNDVPGCPTMLSRMGVTGLLAAALRLSEFDTGEEMDRDSSRFGIPSKLRRGVPPEPGCNGAGERASGSSVIVDVTDGCMSVGGLVSEFETVVAVGVPSSFAGSDAAGMDASPAMAGDGLAAASSTGVTVSAACVIGGSGSGVFCCCALVCVGLVLVSMVVSRSSVFSLTSCITGSSDDGEWPGNESTPAAALDGAEADAVATPAGSGPDTGDEPAGMTG